MRRSATFAATLAAVGSATALTAGLLPATAAVPTDTSALRNAVTLAGVRSHQAALQAIADANGGTRASGTPGYDASADYVAGLLQGAGWTVSRQAFDYELFLLNDTAFERVSPQPTTYAEIDDFFPMEYSGSGNVAAQLVPVDITIPPTPTPSSTSGCEAADFAGFPAGAIALLQRGTCTFREKAENAAAAGAVAAIIFNEGQDGRQEVLFGTLSAPQVAIPTIGISFAIGADLYARTQATPVQVRVMVDATVEQSTTENVIADSKGGRTDRTVMIGAHLDSVPEGPGINDNGSGSAAILETALQMSRLGITPRNAVRVAFWGAEESGLIGSQYYVDQLSARDRKNISAYLNFDMVGSPNFVRFVYDGDGSAFGSSGPNGSAHIENTFTSFFASQGLASEPTEFDGRSDYEAFILAGIPAGGLFTGAEGIKTPEQAAIYGGTAGQPYDPCYHLACDTYANNSDTGLDQMSDAIAHATLTYAMTTSAVNGTAKANANAVKKHDPAFSGHHLRR